MNRVTLLVLVTTAALLMLDYVWRVSSISLRKVLPIAIPLWGVILVLLWYWMA